ncbi:MAG: Stp1/IreP family PP2C-type Ser/Thr phosphatase [Syntrophomonadaceae bacterium]|nr:Stp1/IreP family PP2C-type Ser/Thr phosphatase [Syntrophomonadaceae bacterium]
MQTAVVSDKGLVRAKNEDRYLIAPERRLFVVCDGMGGHRGGEVASSLAIDVIDSMYSCTNEPAASLESSIKTANKVIFSKGIQIAEYHEMGTTLTGAVIHEDSVHVAHVGDSGLYLLRDKQFTKVTRDHTLAQKMAREGFLDANEVRSHPYNHILTRALGIELEVKIDFFHEPIDKGDYILLASDGLTDLVEDHEIGQLIEDLGMGSPDAMLKLALARGGYDNITIILIQV